MKTPRLGTGAAGEGGKRKKPSAAGATGGALRQLHDTHDMIGEHAEQLGNMIGEHAEKLGKAQGLELTLHSRILARVNEAEAALH